MAEASDRPAFARDLFLHPRIAHALGVIVAALLTWLVWLGYRHPGFMVDIANAMTFC
jgi:hypothetical protein